MRKGTFYLNATGSKWIVLPKEKIEFKTKSGKSVFRTPIYFEQFGNFATVRISYKGKKISVFIDTLLND
jgi:hypothetical protein